MNNRKHYSALVSVRFKDPIIERTKTFMSEILDPERYDRKTSMEINWPFPQKCPKRDLADIRAVVRRQTELVEELVEEYRETVKRMPDIEVFYLGDKIEIYKTLEDFKDKSVKEKCLEARADVGFAFKKTSLARVFVDEMKIKFPKYNFSVIKNNSVV